MAIRPKIRDLTKLDFRISLTVPRRGYETHSNLAVVDAEIVYVKPLGYFDIALKCLDGKTYLPLKGDFSCTREKIVPLRDSSLLLLLQTDKITDLQRRVAHFGNYGLLTIFRKCVRNLSPRIREATFDSSTLSSIL